MIEKIIEQIKISENKSKEMVADAKKEHNAIIEKAYVQSSDIENQTKTDIAKMYRDFEEKARKDAGSEVEKIRAEYDKKISEVKDTAAIKEEAAVNFIIRKVIQ